MTLAVASGWLTILFCLVTGECHDLWSNAGIDQKNTDDQLSVTATQKKKSQDPLHSSDFGLDNTLNVRYYPCMTVLETSEALRPVRLQYPRINLQKGGQPEVLLFTVKRVIGGLSTRNGSKDSGFSDLAHSLFPLFSRKYLDIKTLYDKRPPSGRGLGSRPYCSKRIKPWDKAICIPLPQQHASA